MIPYLLTYLVIMICLPSKVPSTMAPRRYEAYLLRRCTNAHSLTWRVLGWHKEAALAPLAHVVIHTLSVCVRASPRPLN